jgi:hypothetical protein
VPVVVLENPDRFAIRLTTEDEHEDDSKFRNLGLSSESAVISRTGPQSALRVIRRRSPRCYTSPRLGALAVRD